LVSGTIAYRDADRFKSPRVLKKIKKEYQKPKPDRKYCVSNHVLFFPLN
jgi:hypothetical protein